MNSMYRSVPPRPLSYTFSDVLQSSLEPRTPGRVRRSRSKTAPVSTNAPDEYAERFKSRPTTRPAVIDFNGTGVKMYKGTGCGGSKRHLNTPGFPAVKIKNINVTNTAPPAGGVKSKTPLPSAPLPPALTERGTTATSSLHLAPLGMGSEPDSALSLQTRPYRQPPAFPPKPSKTPEMSRFHGVQSAASGSLKSSGGGGGGQPRMPNTAKSAASNGNHYHMSEARPAPPAGARSTVSSLRLSAAGGGPHHADPRSMGSSIGDHHHHHPQVSGHWPELSSSKLNTLDTYNTFNFSVSPRGPGGELLGGGGLLPEVLAMAHSDDYDDLSELPRPKRILPRRDLPWVFRFKVKKEMNALSKIMASKPTSASSSIAAGGPMA